MLMLSTDLCCAAIGPLQQGGGAVQPRCVRGRRLPACGRQASDERNHQQDRAWLPGPHALVARGPQAARERRKLGGKKRGTPRQNSPSAEAAGRREGEDLKADRETEPAGNRRRWHRHDPTNYMATAMEVILSTICARC